MSSEGFYSVKMNPLPLSIIPDTWIKVTWDEYLQAVEQCMPEKVKAYYNQGQCKLEMTPLGFDHGCDHYIIILAVSLYGIAKGINFRGIDNCSYRKTGYQEAQPDISYYIGECANVIPHGTYIVNLEQYPAPNLVVEIAKTTLADDLGKKRLLYEELGVSEYWVIDVENAEVIAFQVNYQGSQRIKISQVFLGLEISILNEALEKTRQNHHTFVGQWLIEQFK